MKTLFGLHVLTAVGLGIHNRRATRMALAALAVIMFTACATSPRSAYQPLTETERESSKADKLCHQAAPMICSNLGKAEKLLREALAADLYHGPSHNNLGVVYLKGGRLFEAAGEFEWARKLMPGCPEPRVNLALTLEQAGHTDEAINTYQSALEIRPEHLPAVQALTRLELRAGKPSDSTDARLKLIALRGDPMWRDWAQGQLNLKLNAP